MHSNNNIGNHNTAGATATEDNPALQLARDIVEHTASNLFLTGKAGTGKTTFLRRLVQESRKQIVVVAPTGVAAINAGGSTIHSFFQLNPNAPIGAPVERENKIFKMSKIKKGLMRGMDLLVIDEISMVRPDLLDQVDEVLRRYRNPMLPFGGVQLLMIGDLRQLAPVVTDDEVEVLKRLYPTPYFFDSRALRQSGFFTVELDKIYRQDDQEFIDILNAIRDNRADQSVLEKLNRRYIPGFVIPEGEGYVNLTTHNFMADRINQAGMAALKTRREIYHARVEGKFPESMYPLPIDLELKIGAQVMFVKNDPQGLFYNGMIGKVVNMTDETVTVRPQNGGDEICVTPMPWENSSYIISKETGLVSSTVEGTFAQIPLRPAWAITIHKSQGLTFKHAVIDASRSFAPGQTYVALSRCTSLEGMVLNAPLPASAVISDPTVSAFIESQQSNTPDGILLERLKRDFFARQVYDIFDFSIINRQLKSLYDFIARELSSHLPALFSNVASECQRFDAEIISVSNNFFRLASTLIQNDEEFKTGSTLRTKMRNGAAYFVGKLAPLTKIMQEMPQNLNNKQNAERLSNILDALHELLGVKIQLLNWAATNEFTVEACLQCRAKATFSNAGIRPTASRKTGGQRKSTRTSGKTATKTSRPKAKKKSYPSFD